jgi:hypothetical protein
MPYDAMDLSANRTGQSPGLCLVSCAGATLRGAYRDRWLRGFHDFLSLIFKSPGFGFDLYQARNVAVI